jgi:hypothetical protein
VSKQIRIVPVYRDQIDVERLAEALLDLIDSLNEEQRARFLADGEANKAKGGSAARKGSAA